MSTDITLYGCQDLINEIEALAAQNDGEISEEQLQALVVAQTTSMEKVGKLAGFIKFCERWIDLCKMEEARIARQRKIMENRLESIETYLVPFVKQYRESNGHPLNVGTFTLSTRKSSAVEIDELAFFTEENRKRFCTEKVSYVPDKKAIKAELDDPLATVEGAKIVEHDSLQVR